jgi:hypothetical protein
LELERAIADSVEKMLATTPYQTMMQDNGGEDEDEDEILESTKAKAIMPLSSKHKG